jgi:hypothetical protein
VVIGEPRRDEKKYPCRQVALEKDEMGRTSLQLPLGHLLRKNQQETIIKSKQTAAERCWRLTKPA